MTIKVSRPSNIEAVFARAKSDAEKHGITWSGDINQGQGSGFGFEGMYRVDTDNITITILKRPLFATKSRIKREIERYVAD